MDDGKRNMGPVGHNLVTSGNIKFLKVYILSFFHIFIYNKNLHYVFLQNFIENKSMTERQYQYIFDLSELETIMTSPIGYKPEMCVKVKPKGRKPLPFKISLCYYFLINVINEKELSHIFWYCVMLFC